VDTLTDGLVGANDASKSTLFDIVCRRLRATRGRVLLDVGCGRLGPTHGRVRLIERDVTGIPTHRRTRLQLDRTYQRLSVIAQRPEAFSSLSVAEILLVAARAMDRMKPGRVDRPHEAGPSRPTT
jgi:ABC-type branched-subunit amino acid transport system ATPase component